MKKFAVLALVTLAVALVASGTAGARTQALTPAEKVSADATQRRLEEGDRAPEAGQDAQHEGDFGGADWPRLLSSWTSARTP